MPEARLYFAISDDDTDTVTQLLLTSSLNVNYMYCGDGPASQWCALHICAEKGRHECARLLLEAGADPNMHDRYRQTPLFYAIAKEWPDIVHLLLGHGADARVWDKDGREPIHVAAKCSDGSILRLLADVTIDVNIRDADGRTPLWHALSVSEGRLRNAQMLIARGADVNAVDARFDRNPLQVAIMSMERELDDAVCLLLTHNADFLSTDFRCQNSLMNVVQRWYELSGKGRLTKRLVCDLLTSFSMLLLTGVDINICSGVSRNGGTVLHLAAKLGADHRLLRIILDADADVNALDSEEMTPLHRAAMFGNVGVAKVLLEAGANAELLTLYEANHYTDERDVILCSAFRLALERNHLPFAIFLTDARYAPTADDYPPSARAQRHLQVLRDSNAYIDAWLRQIQAPKTARKQPRALFDMCVSAVRYHVAASRSAVRRLPLPASLLRELSVGNILKDSVTWT